MVKLKNVKSDITPWYRGKGIAKGLRKHGWYIDPRYENNINLWYRKDLDKVLIHGGPPGRQLKLTEREALKCIKAIRGDDGKPIIVEGGHKDLQKHIERSFWYFFRNDASEKEISKNETIKDWKRKITKKRRKSKINKNERSKKNSRKAGNRTNR